MLQWIQHRSMGVGASGDKGDIANARYETQVTSGDRQDAASEHLPVHSRCSAPLWGSILRKNGPETIKPTGWDFLFILSCPSLGFSPPSLCSLQVSHLSSPATPNVSQYLPSRMCLVPRYSSAPCIRQAVQGPSRLGLRAPGWVTPVSKRTEECMLPPA